MFLSMAGTPAGYGYLIETAPAGQDVWPIIRRSIFNTDEDKSLGAPIIAGSVRIKVDTATQVSINGRSPVMVTPDCPLYFNARGIASVIFTGATKYDFTISY